MAKTGVFNLRNLVVGVSGRTENFAVLAGDVLVGTLAVVHPTVLSNVDKKCAVAFFEISTEAFAAVESGVLKYREPSKFPEIDIDVTFTADLAALVFENVKCTAKASAGALLSDVKVADVYTADGVSALTLRFSFVSDERTLTKQELTPVVDKLTADLSACGLILKA